MLIKEDTILNGSDDPYMSAILNMIANGNPSRELREGIYEIHHFGGSRFPGREYESYPELSIGPYGVCDTVEQVLEKCPELEASNRKFVITVTPIIKSKQPPEGGWRWHKWGEYIGTQDPQCEYIYDEPHIERVLCFHIYERI